MPVKETPNTVTVGQICQTCGLFNMGSCPYENHLKKSILEYSGDIRGKCTQFAPITEAKSIKMKKNAEIKKAEERMEMTQLHIALYKKLYSLNKKEQKRFIEYWDSVFPTEYAEAMGTDVNESVPHNLKKRKKKKGK
jgi:hypothetical protein